MADQPEFDVAAAHRYFATQCYNDAFDLIDKRDRSADDDARMLHLSMSSLWHWTQRADCTSTNLSIGYWQVARIYALLGQPDNARRDGLRCCCNCSAARRSCPGGTSSVDTCGCPISAA